MSELKSQKVFESDSYSAQASQEEALDKMAKQKIFKQEATFVPQSLRGDNASETEKGLDNIELEMERLFSKKQSSKKQSRWGIKIVVVTFLGLMVWQSVDYVISAIQMQRFLPLAWSILIGLTALMGVGAVGRELLKLRSLKNRTYTKWRAKELIEKGDIGQATAFCDSLARKNNMDKTSVFADWKKCVEPHHNDSEVMELYSRIVLSAQDKQVQSLIVKHAKESALMVAVSPLAVVDMLLVGWRNIRLIEKISHIYGVELGYWGRLRLFKMVLANMAFAGTAEIVTDLGVDLLSTGLASRLSSQVAQGLGVGVITARFGLKTMNLMRPLPWLSEQELTLSDVRKMITSQLLSQFGSK